MADNYYRARAPQNLRYVLEAIDHAGPAAAKYIAENIGIHRNEAQYAILLGTKLDLVERRGLTASTTYHLTERGRITLAVWRGKERKRIAGGRNGMVHAREGGHGDDVQDH